MKLHQRLSDREVTQLQSLMLSEGQRPADIEDPGALTDLLGKGLVRIEFGRYWPNWDAISRDPA